MVFSYLFSVGQAKLPHDTYKIILNKIWESVKPFWQNKKEDILCEKFCYLSREKYSIIKLTKYGPKSDFGMR
jgi:hypothetical protein